MDLEMVLNELSLQTPFADIPTARKLMSELIQTFIQARKLGVKILRTHSDLNYIKLTPNYPIVSWRNDREVDREERIFFRSLITKVPLCSDVTEEIKSKFDLSEVWYQGKLAEGLRLALISDYIAISLLSKPQWDTDFLELQVTEIDENEQLTDYSEKIVHASQSSHVKQHTEWIKNRNKNILFNRDIDGQAVWESRQEFFPSLIFCEQISQQLQNLNIGDPILQQVKKRLFELE
ncbi:MAG: hypothetical protein WBA93_10160 [Microcoleaceae cyanobacterium]